MNRYSPAQAAAARRFLCRPQEERWEDACRLRRMACFMVRGQDPRPLSSDEALGVVLYSDSDGGSAGSCTVKLLVATR
jgi:hypothetical protein